MVMGFSLKVEFLLLALFFRSIATKALASFGAGPQSRPYLWVCLDSAMTIT